MASTRFLAAATRVLKLKVPARRFRPGLGPAPCKGLFFFSVGVSPENVGLVIGTYGIVWLVWLVVNRIVCDHMDMMVRFILGRFGP